MNASGKGRRLVLHFDINKTIVMKDSLDELPSVTLTVSLITNLSFLYIKVCTIIAKIAWGKVVTKKVAADREEQIW